MSKVHQSGLMEFPLLLQAYSCGIVSQDDTFAAGGEEGKVEMYSITEKKQVHSISTDTNRFDLVSSIVNY